LSPIRRRQRIPTLFPYTTLFRSQSHPDEDFAETFAVWLTPESQWQQRYAGWPALKKLTYVDQLMRTLAGKTPRVAVTEEVDPLRSEEHTSELQSPCNLVCRLLLE